MWIFTQLFTFCYGNIEMSVNSEMSVNIEISVNIEMPVNDDVLGHSSSCEGYHTANSLLRSQRQ